MSADGVVTTGEEETAAAGEQLAATLHPARSCSSTASSGRQDRVRARPGPRPRRRRDDVSSPTFTIIQEYAGRTATLYHVDLYRLEPAEVDDLGLDELVSGDGIVAIEWAERWRGRPDDAIEVTIEDRGGERRLIRVQVGSRLSAPGSSKPSKACLDGLPKA